MTGSVFTRYLDGQRAFLDLFLWRHQAAMSASDVRRARVLVALLIFGFLACSAMATVRYFTAGWLPSTVVVAFSPFLILAALLVFIRTGDSRLSGDILVATVTLIILATAFTDGGLTSRVLTWLPALPLMANFTGARLTALRICVLVLVALIIMRLGHEMHWLESAGLEDSLTGRLAASFASMLFVAAISYAYEDSRRCADEEREALAKTRDDWVSMVSHELRTPLTSLYGGLKLLAGEKLEDKPEQKRLLLKTTVRNTERLMRLVNDILDVERLRAGKLRLTFKRLSLGEVVREAVETQQYFADECGVSIRCQDVDVPRIHADHDRLLQVVQNLLSNAIKFSERGQEVTVSLSSSEQGVTCEVIDQGAGVSEGFRDELFNRFAQQEAGANRRSGGSGLGLFICNGIIASHQGVIGHRPRPEGGSVFFFRLPLAT